MPAFGINLGMIAWSLQRIFSWKVFGDSFDYRCYRVSATSV